MISQIFIKSRQIFEFYSWVFVQWFLQKCSKEIQPAKIPSELTFWCERTNDDHNHMLNIKSFSAPPSEKIHLKRIQGSSKDFGLRMQLLYFQQIGCHKGLVTYFAISSHTFPIFLSQGSANWCPLITIYWSANPCLPW